MNQNNYLQDYNMTVQELQNQLKESVEIKEKHLNILI